MARFTVPRSQLGRTARLGSLSSRLSLRWLVTRLRARFAPAARRAELLEAYHLKSAEEVAAALGNMKGALMKLGQMMSFVSDDVPAEWRTALAQLQQNAPPMAFDLARTVIEQDLGGRLRDHFRDVDAVPLAAASIGQVHRARLRSGEDVVVKVQYPGVADAIRADLANLPWLYGLLALMNPGLDPQPLAAELRARIEEELDYRREARSQTAFATLYDEHPFVRIPRVFPSHSADHVLTTGFAPGERFAWAEAQPDPVRQRFGEILYRFVFASIGHFHVFNGDPHPGNYLFGPDGTVTFLDFGCVKFFEPAMLTRWKGVLRTHLEGDADEFKRRIQEFRFIAPDAPAPAERLYRYFGYFYEPFARDRPFTFTHEYASKSLGMVFDRSHPEWADLIPQFNMPPDFAFVNRIQWGLYSILASLEATGNWHRIHREHLYGDPPATPLGREDYAHRIAWKRARGLREDATVWLDPSGVRWSGDGRG